MTLLNAAISVLVFLLIVEGARRYLNLRHEQWWESLSPEKREYYTILGENPHFPFESYENYKRFTEYQRTHYMGEKRPEVISVIEWLKLNVDETKPLDEQWCKELLLRVQTGRKAES